MSIGKLPTKHRYGNLKGNQKERNFNKRGRTCYSVVYSRQTQHLTIQQP